MTPPTATLPRRIALDLTGVTTDPRAVHAAREPNEPNRLWIADLSQVWAANAWLYFAFVLDGHDRRCLGFASHRVLHAGLVATAVERASAVRGQSPGAPDPAIVFSRRCHSAGIGFPSWAIPSAADTAVADSFPTALRRALLDDDDEDSWGSQGEATTAIEAWIDRDYNPEPARVARVRFAPRARERVAS